MVVLLRRRHRVTAVCHHLQTARSAVPQGAGPSSGRSAPGRQEVSSLALYPVQYAEMEAVLLHAAHGSRAVLEPVLSSGLRALVRPAADEGAELPLEATADAAWGQHPDAADGVCAACGCADK